MGSWSSPTGVGVSVSQDELVPVENNLLWELVRGGAKFYYAEDPLEFVYAYPTSYADKAIKAVCGPAPGDDHYAQLAGRIQDAANFYYIVIYTPASTADFKLRKWVSSTATEFGSESVDLDYKTHYVCKLSISGSDLKAYRVDMTTPKLTATDTTFSSGYWGIVEAGSGWRLVSLGNFITCQLLAPSSPDPKVLKYVQTEVIGTGTPEDPFRAYLPLELIDTEYGKSNALSVTYSALIPTGKDGKPLDYTTVVRIFEQPDRPTHIRSLDDAVSRILSDPKVKELTRDEAVSLALKLDDKLDKDKLKRW